MHAFFFPIFLLFIWIYELGVGFGSKRIHKKKTANIFAIDSIRTKMLGGSTIGAAGALQNINSSSASSYSNERTPTAGLDVEFASDAASGGFFHADYKK